MMLIRALVIDDATAGPELLDALRADSALHVTNFCGDLKQSVEKVRRLRPDVVVLGGRLQHLDDFALTKRIMDSAPTPIVIAVGDHDSHIVSMAMQALRAGALAAVRKPKKPGSPEFQDVCRELVVTVKTMSQVKVVRRWLDALPDGPKAPSLPVPSPSPSPAKDRHFRALAIAASTGGPAALQAILGALPRDFPLPILVVQHIAAGFAAGVADWLDGCGPLRVKIARHGEAATPGTVYLASEAHHLGVASGSAPGIVIALSTASPVGGFRPSASFLFQSVAETLGPSVCAVMLTGMGEDGVRGLRAVHEHGGYVLAQDEASSVVFGMPGAAIATGVVDETLPLSGLARRLRALAHHE